tara:strand:- start:850 stop:1065 length:216 start_codon:yes stop_codon:yes gene_type:complete
MMKSSGSMMKSSSKKSRGGMAMKSSNSSGGGGIFSNLFSGFGGKKAEAAPISVKKVEKKEKTSWFGSKAVD